MFECLFLGDSLAVGTAQFTNARLARPCTVVATEGATARQIEAWRKPARSFGVTVIAIGSNDMPDDVLSARLTRIRASITSRRVIWLLPYSRPRFYVVSSVAARFRDETLDMLRFPSRDGLHPKRYQDVANSLLR
ncbi:hypothetical protein [Novosphingobium aquimarinum]|jgi:hypothetical protein|uniref:hypothetical protein n=1 Tax=Novosphingobium aquimarinum TaxID=2682494 RepID=UPI0012EB22AD|nr:hypothetical protein [Novosphingobium aquimarinum]